MTEKEMLLELGENIKSCMEDANMTQRELANEIGVTEATISYYLRGERMPSLTNIVNIAYALGFGIDEIVNFDNVSIE